MSLARSKASVRTSLNASTLDGVLAAVFTSLTSGVLLSDFMLQLKASTFEIGLLAAIPMLVNVVQPLGAHWADCTTSRRRYGLFTFGGARSLWLLILPAILLAHWSHWHLSPQLVLALCLVSSLLAALGGASWFSWLGALVPTRLRGRYFSTRNTAVSLTTLLFLPLAGWLVDTWPGGSFQGYGVMLLLAVVAGLASIAVQGYMADVNPQDEQCQVLESTAASAQPLQDVNFRVFLGYHALWTFALNLSAPFFALYLLDSLSLGLVWVTAYSSLSAAANILTLRFWGRIADRTGNRPLLWLSGLAVAVTPLLWLGTGQGYWSVWLWLPLIYILSGTTTSALDLCTHNIQLNLAPRTQNSAYFAVAAAVSGITGALGAALGGYLGQCQFVGGLLGLFALSTVLRLVALLPLLRVQEAPAHSVPQTVQLLRTEFLNFAVRMPTLFVPPAAPPKLAVLAPAGDQAEAEYDEQELTSVGGSSS